MTKHATLLTEPHNYAVVQLPERNFPGVVFQGDSLHNLLRQITEIRALAVRGTEREELLAELDDLYALFRDLEYGYAKVCSAHGIDLPYARDQ
jgi:hypothetical protein